MIDQNTTISQQLTLWDQRGSGVIRGKLVVIPIENSFLYVVPLYLRAEGTNFPQPQARHRGHGKQGGDAADAGRSFSPPCSVRRKSSGRAPERA